MLSTYKKMFAAASVGKKDEVAALAARLKNTVVDGCTSRPRAISVSNTVAEFDDLKAWLTEVRRLSGGQTHPRCWPSARTEARGRACRSRSSDHSRQFDEADWVAPDYASPAAEAGAKKLKSLISSGSLKAATAYLDGAELKSKLSRADYGRLAYQVAAGQYYLGDPNTALVLAGAVAADCAPKCPTPIGLRVSPRSGLRNTMLRRRTSRRWRTIRRRRRG